jgi:hypothetical protein
MWTDETLEAIIDTIERGTCFLRRANKQWNIPLNSFSNHLNRKSRSRKMGSRGVFTKEEDVVVIKWTLDMQKCKLSISLQQLKMKIVELTQKIHNSKIEY